MKTKKSIAILVAAACILSVILLTKNDAQAGKSCVPSFDDCASDEYCYQKNAINTGVCVRITFVKQVP